MNEFTVTVTEKHLDEHLKQDFDSLEYRATRSCIVAKALKEKFPNEFKVVGFNIASFTPNLKYECPEAYKITAISEKRELLESQIRPLLPMDLVFKLIS